MPVAAIPGILVGDNDQVRHAHPDALLAAGTPVHLLPRHLPHGDAVELGPLRGHAPKRAHWLRHGAIPGGTVAARHLGSILFCVVSQDIPSDLEAIRSIGEGKFPALLGIDVLEVRHGETHMRLNVEGKHVAPNGYLHAGAVVGLADTACGYGCIASLPQGASGFTTIELKTNFFGTALEGTINCTARLVHGGRTTQVWDADVVAEGSGKRIALFRCTQLLLYPGG